MHIRLRMIASAFAATLAFGLIVAPSGALAGSSKLSFPHDCATLQACIKHVASGGVVQIDTNSTVMEDIAIHKSLTLRSAPGRHGGVRSIEVSSTSKRLDVTVSDLTIPQGVDSFLFGSPAGSRLQLLRLHLGDPAGAPVLLEADTPLSFTVKSSTVEATAGTGEDAISIDLDHDSGTSRINLIGNRLTGHGDPSTENGIDLGINSTGTVVADIINNSIWDFGTCNCGAASDILINVGSNIAVADIDFVGNTLDTSTSYGLQLRNDLLDGADLTLRVFDNIFTNAQRSAIRLRNFEASTLTYEGGNNDEFGNADPDDVDGGTVDFGTGNVSVDPMYRDPLIGDFRLKAGSPVIDAGLVCSPGGVVNLDAAGHGRVIGRSVDMGALERGAGLPTGVVFLGTDGHDHFVGTSGADIMCGYGGPDTMNGKHAGDFLDGGSGPDTVVGGPGPDVVLGGTGGDTLCLHDGVNGNDFGDGGTGDDSYQADDTDLLMNVEHQVIC